jgi:hypothetical protein
MLKTIFIRSEPMSAIFVKMPPAMRARSAERLADRKADEAGARARRRNEQQNHQHDEQLGADQHHADAHAALSGIA